MGVIIEDTWILAEFAPLCSLTGYELAQAHAVVGENRVFSIEAWEYLGVTQRHWKPLERQGNKRIEEPGTHMADAETRPWSLECDHVIAQAAALIVRWGGIDGAHHQQWVLDQVLRILLGTGYREFIALIANWSEGIAP